MFGASTLIMVASIALAYFSAKIAMAFGRDLGSAVFTSVETFSAREFNQLGVHHRSRELLRLCFGHSCYC